MAYDKDLPWRLDTLVDILPYHVHMNGVAPVVNTYGAIDTYLANEMLPVDLRRLDVRTNEREKCRQAWKRRKCHMWGQAAPYTPSEKRRFSSEV